MFDFKHRTDLSMPLSTIAKLEPHPGVEYKIAFSPEIGMVMGMTVCRLGEERALNVSYFTTRPPCADETGRLNRTYTMEPKIGFNPAPQKSSPVNEATNELERQVNILTARLDALQDNLSPALRPEIPTTKPDGCMAPAHVASDLTVMLRGLAARVEDATNRVDDLNARVEL